MKRLYVIGSVLLLTALVIGIFFWMSYLDMRSALKHDGNRWAVITDSEGSSIAVEPTNDKVWEQLIGLHQNNNKRSVGGVVEQYENKWGFRFKPKNVTVAEFTAEGLQATIRYICENLDYWLGSWAYVSARVTETYSP